LNRSLSGLPQSTIRPRTHAIAALLVLFALAVAPKTTEAFASYSYCRYDSGTVHLNLASDHVVRLLAVDGRIEYADLRDNSRQGRCGKATVRNTDRVRVTEAMAGTSRLQFDQQLQRFGPGRTAESTGVSEIEVHLGTVRDVWLMGRDVREVVTIGTKGVNLNGDGDADLIGSSLVRITVFLFDGEDNLSAGGGHGTRDAWLPTSGGWLAAYGGDGNDVIVGTRRRDYLYGGLGDDRLTGSGGKDDIFGDEGNDRISAGSGADYVDPGYGSDSVNSGSGDDFISAADYTVDSIDGEAGTDRASVDSVDSVTNVETLTIGP
jgi:RTX calcium-binding nonapeptide repeat (4 copies)